MNRKGRGVRINLFDYEEAAGRALESMAYDYYRSGADDEVSLRRNRQAYERLCLHYRVLVDVSRRNLSTTVLGTPISFPVLAAPTAFHALAHPEGEVATARAVTAEGTIFILSTLSNRPMEEVVQAASGPVWFQLYCYKDRGATRALVERAQEAGCQGLVLTVDAPVLGRRERDVRNEFHLPPGLRVSNLTATGRDRVDHVDQESGLAAYARYLDSSLSWKDLEWLRCATDVPVLVKGIVRPDDAVRAADHGADGVVISNHGGRQLDTAPAPIEVLPAIAEAVEGRIQLLVDGGIRRGTDVLKALALGARAVLLGRPILWGLAVEGEAGVRRVLQLLRDELDVALALCGCPEVAQLGPDLVRG
ncbi:MAG: alpha-hydroxy acid oxidase [Candidatus Eremiobacterota bacterium]